MFNLVLKDFLIQKTFIKDIVISIPVCMLIFQFFGAPCIYIMTPIVFAISFIVDSYGFGEENAVDRIISSLPVSRKEIVFSKYLSSFIFFIIGIVITLVFGTITKLSGFSNINRFMNLQDIMIAYVFTTIYISIYLPIYLWLGYVKSESINNILMLVIFFCLIFTVVVVTFAENGTANDYIMNLTSLPNFKLVMFISCICSSIILTLISIVTSLKLYVNKNL